MAFRLGLAAPAIEDDDVALYVDDSRFMEEPGDARKEELMTAVKVLASIVTVMGDGRISLRFFNSDIELDGFHSVEEVMTVMGEVEFIGDKSMATNLEARIIQPLIVGPAKSGKLRKPVQVVILTCGHSEGDDHQVVSDALRRCKADLVGTRYGVGAAAFQFAQLGGDKATERLLEDLGSDEGPGYLAKRVDFTRGFASEAESWAKHGDVLGLGIYAYKLLTGAIDGSKPFDNV
ncbi:hypothetical protein DFJ74DRAFT_765658 [Hyaloraphidium curvatum]|nr:hypothetical protein DFJ74DRAFT_765658 [Hyaloraphidium curvatum]